ncbi:MAG TPA: L,D-transpeptidase [Burkholderiales bacterium]|nr:L,D-transpeptidase [Burkholderiales bacterium]
MRAIISLARQELILVTEEGDVVGQYLVSTAKAGGGEKSGSGCTPRGLHKVRARIGEGLPENSILVGRRPTGEVYTQDMARQCPGREYILSRILWLSGLEPGINRMGDVDTMRRYIYIHGTPDCEPMGIPASHGCIRMRSADVMLLFDELPVGSLVEISED